MILLVRDMLDYISSVLVSTGGDGFFHSEGSVVLMLTASNDSNMFENLSLFRDRPCHVNVYGLTFII